MRTHKTCSRCRQELPLDRFYIYQGKCPHRPGQPHAACKDCEFSARNRHRQANPEAASAVARRAKLKRMFGITPELYDQMHASQQGRCAICLRESPDGRRLHVDHCHATKKVRGLLCHDCNRGLGMFRDAPDLMTRAARYLRCASK